jgi:hypothetical protein
LLDDDVSGRDLRDHRPFRRRDDPASRDRLGRASHARRCSSTIGHGRVRSTVAAFNKVSRMEQNLRTRIQKALITGDNRLKQGVEPAKVRESYEQALELAREAGIEEKIKPLVEFRLADLAKLEAESLPPAPPEG